MPVITIEISKITKEQKEQLVKELVTKASEILQIREDAFYTYIHENEKDNIGIGTKLRSTF